jgi:hypothetical protein
MARNFLYTAYLVIYYRSLLFRSYALMKRSGGSECLYSCFKYVGNCSYFWAMVGESGPDLVSFQSFGRFSGVTVV